jgi:hypothetical protein
MSAGAAPFTAVTDKVHPAIGMQLGGGIIGPVASLDSARRDRAVVDVGELVRRLLLFSRVYLESIRLLEMPTLLREFGYDGTRELLNSGVVRIRADAVVIGQVGQSEVGGRTHDSLLPLGSYAFRTFAPDRDEYVRQCLMVVDRIEGLGHPEHARTIEEAILGAMEDRAVDEGEPALDGLCQDLANNAPIVKSAVGICLARELGVDVDPGAFSLTMHNLGDREFRAESDIVERFNLDPEAVHKVVEAACLGVGGINQRLERMRRYRAAADLWPGDLPLLDRKIDFLAFELAPSATEGRWRRVLDIAGLPDVPKSVGPVGVDMHRLLEVRESSECIEFRDWLNRTDVASDDEIRERVTSLRSQLGSWADRLPGKTVRLAVATGLGLISPIASTVASAIDTFVLQSVLSQSGIRTFLNGQYPSIFFRPVVQPSDKLKGPPDHSLT